MRSHNRQAGFTLIEMMVVMVIIGLLMALVGPRFIRQEEKAKVRAARAQIELLGTALDTFRLDIGRYPSSQESLAALRQRPFGVDRWDGPYLKKDLPRDPWEHPYYYRSPGDGGRTGGTSPAGKATPGERRRERPGARAGRGTRLHVPRDRRRPDHHRARHRRRHPDGRGGIRRPRGPQGGAPDRLHDALLPG
jgi:general secretion pathway protein G